MAVEDIEKRVRAMTGKKDIPDDKQQAAFQSAQNELVRINSERQNNLALANAEANADAQVNETLLQAGEMASMGSPAVQQQVESMNPQTQAVLSKYGLGKPRVQRTQGREVKVTPQKVQITNNNITNTTNNVSVPPANVGGPVQGRTLAVKQADPEQARFKTWIQSAFARQNAKAAQREKEYQRREWSLSRSANKMMKYLSDLGSNISEKLNPNKMAATVGGQFKTILFLFGTMFLAKHWKRVIEIGANIEEFFLGANGEAADGKGRGRPGFAKMLIGLFGGNPNDSEASIGETIKRFFWNKDRKDGVFNILFDKIENFFKERADAVKAIELPELDFSDISGTLKGLLGYLGDIFKAFVGGADAVKESIGNSINRASLKSEKKFAYGNNIGYKVEDTEGGMFSNTSYGDKVLTEKKDGKSAVHVLPGAIDSDGNLTDKASSSISQSNSLAYSLSNNAKHGYFETAKVSAGLSRIAKAVEDKGDVPVSTEFLTEFLSQEQIESLMRDKHIVNKPFKYHKREKTKEELEREGAGDFLETAGKSLIFNEATQFGGGGFGTNLTKSIITDNPNHFFGTKFGAVMDGADAKINKFLSNKYTWDLVPKDEKVAGERDKSGKLILHYFPTIDEEVINTIKKNINAKSTNLGDKDYTMAVQSFIEKKYDGKTKAKIFDAETGEEIKSNYDIDVNETYKSLNNIIKESEKRDAELDKKIENSPMMKGFEYFSSGISNAYNGVVNYLSGEKEDNVKYPPIAKSDEEFVNKMRKIYSDILAKRGIDQKYVDALVAQDSLESNWGKSQSGKFNFGGVTVSDRLAKSGKVSYTVKRANGDGKLKKWRNFDSVEDYANYHVRLLNTDKGFSIPYHAFDGNDINDFINRIVNNGYAQEGKKYGDALAIRYSQVQNVPQENGTPILPDNTQQSPTSPDASGVYTAQNITEPENYVERIPSPASYTTYDWNSSNNGFPNWNMDSEALAIATKNATSTVTPSSVTPVSISSSGSSDYNTPSANTARELVANNDMTEIAKGISGKISTLNENIKVLQTGQLAQAESINNLSAAIGNIQININAGGQQKTPVQSATGVPYQAKWG